jgi:nicotinamidase-related amidase
MLKTFYNRVRQWFQANVDTDQRNDDQQYALEDPDQISRVRQALQKLAGDPDKIALLVIDVQRRYCDPSLKRGNEATHKAAGKIAELAPVFREAGVDVYCVYTSPEITGHFNQNTAEETAQFDFYRFTPDYDNDTLIPKTSQSAFQSGNLKNVLCDRGKSQLLVCGVNLSACVFDTVMDARDHAFQVTILRDLTADDDIEEVPIIQDINAFRHNGVNIADTRFFLCPNPPWYKSYIQFAKNWEYTP